jgi:DnaJ-class molecular chaperone
MSNYYETLGVSQQSTPDEIKSAYRKLAMQWHPDKNSGNPDAEQKFKEISNAYETLSDDNKRRGYDAVLHGHQHPGNMHFNMNFGGNMDDILAQFFNHHGFGGMHRQQRNRDMNLSMNITLEDAYTGKTVPIKYTTPAGKNIDLVVNIPSGVDNGTRIRYTGQGEQTDSSLPPGDLYIQIHVSEHQVFMRAGPTLETKIKVDALSAIIGKTVQFVCIDGSIIEVNIPAGIQYGNKLRVGGKGMPVQHNSHQKGDLLIQVEVVTATGLTEDQINTLKNIQVQRGI